MAAVREAELRDAEGAISVIRRSITELCAEDHRGDADTIAKWLANKTPRAFRTWLSTDDNFCVVAESDSEVVGVGLIHRSGEVRLCYLSPGAQRQGIGKAIYSALEAKARQWGLRKLTLESTAGACAFYERVGYRRAGASKPGFGISRCHPYEKSLQPSSLTQPTGQERPAADQEC